ncbi:MAG: T9SS type A sorting domain-containing protein [Bacteroidetes bacterium]|nr:T9SS type A sorting domain-containing protein [Bacteroidota bacterium]
MKNFKHIIIAASFITITQIGFGQVSFTNLLNQPPDNIISIINDPTSSDIYAASSIKVIKSTDAGVTWTLTANTGAQNINVIYFTPGGQLYAGVDKTNGTNLGLIKYISASNTWTAVAGSPQDITAIVEDNSGNLILGTGTTGNYGATNPINKSSGMYYYNVATSTWSSINTGLPIVATYTVFPFIKNLLKTTSGSVIAATYGNGVLQYNGTSWSNYGTGLSNNYVNTLALTSSGNLLAGTDAGVSVVTNSAGAWSAVNSGLPSNKPVRAIAINSAGNWFAGLGFYHYQNGNMIGDIYSSTNNGISWVNTSTGYVGGVIYSMCSHSSGNLFVGSAGIWKSLNNGASWAYSMTGVKIVNQTAKLVKNSAGDIFVLCRNNLLGTRLPYGGVFKSTDNGVTWQQIVNGIKAQGLNEIFVDSQDNIWLSGGVLKSNANGTGTIWGTPELYKSINAGTTWVQNTSIVGASASYDYIKEASNGKLYVASSFGTGQTNISSTIDYNTFDNTLNLPPNNGYHSYGLAVNSANDVFQGTEINGIMRSTNNGAPGSFASITTGATFTASTPCPLGNAGVFVDPYSQYVFGTGTNGTTAGIRYYGSTNTNNGTNMFPFVNFPPTWTAVADVAFSNTGKMFTLIQSSQFYQVGFYETQGPFNTNSIFTKAISTGTLSYYFTSLYIDKCGYLYGLSPNGGISISNGHVNTPAQSVLSLPANNATGVSLTPSLIWNTLCIADSFKIQVSTVSNFSNTIINQANVIANNYSIPASILNPNTMYYWRVYGVNNLGVGAWSNTFNFTTGTLTDLSKNTLQSHISVYPNPTNDVITIMFNMQGADRIIEISDMTGRVIDKVECKEQSKIISLKSLPNGIYFIKCGNDIQKIIKN